jgi:hypothetical protein
MIYPFPLLVIKYTTVIEAFFELIQFEEIWDTLCCLLTS